MQASEGQRITTRYFGGYEGVRVVEVGADHYIVSRFGGQSLDVMPKDEIAKAFDDAGNEVFCSDRERAWNAGPSEIIQ